MKRKKLVLPILAIIFVALGVFIMNEGGEKKVPKIVDEISDRYGTVVNYDHFLSDGMKSKKLTPLDKENLERFIGTNLDVLSGKVSLDDVGNKDASIKVDLFVPKIPTDPVVTGTLYTYIISRPSQATRGIVGGFSSDIDRKDGDAPWKYSNITMSNSDKVEILTNFGQADFEKLELKFVKKFLMSDLKSETKKIDFSPYYDYRKFHSSDYNWLGYAFYKFTTVKNSVPLTVVFAVKEDQYSEHETYPKNWFYVYMKRES
ncbi:hypothetical protein BI347_22360 [Chromobacterium sphagni]|uniref:Uncharacterized protein n=2 Tax=Chromobacterium sphagni TaxID=1903179 RepID=A0A1S1WT51_9NEIS|nr:hypothetical protein BI347_22360 [Chromobacterium sphagni]